MSRYENVDPFVHAKMQEAFNITKAHLLAQNAKCMNETGMCCYRNAGLKCAVGALIPDEDYTEKMEGRFANSGLIMDVLVKRFNFPDLLSEKLWPFTDMLLDIQSTHDTYSVSTWESRLREIALLYELSYGEEITEPTSEIKL